MADAREAAATKPLLLHRAWHMALLILMLWIVGLVWLVHWLVSTYGDPKSQMYEWVYLAATAGVCVILAIVWAVSRVRFERRRQEQWEAALLRSNEPEGEV
jgi:hypothetical protein